jgi:hypothetical protein
LTNLGARQRCRAGRFGAFARDQDLEWRLRCSVGGRFALRYLWSTHCRRGWLHLRLDLDGERRPKYDFDADLRGNCVAFTGGGLEPPALNLGRCHARERFVDFVW